MCNTPNRRGAVMMQKRWHIQSRHIVFAAIVVFALTAWLIAGTAWMVNAINSH